MLNFKDFISESFSGSRLSSADAKLQKKKDAAINKAKAWMKKMNKSAEEAAKEFDLKVDDLNEGTFNSKDVLGYDAFIVTDGKEMFSDSGEIMKLPKDHDLWANKGKRYSNFLIKNKKEAEAQAKEFGAKVRAVTLSQDINEASKYDSVTGKEVYKVIIKKSNIDLKKFSYEADKIKTLSDEVVFFATDKGKKPSQDQFQMYLVDNNDSDKVVSLGSHPSLDGLKKFAKNNFGV